MDYGFTHLLNCINDRNFSIYCILAIQTCELEKANPLYPCANASHDCRGNQKLFCYFAVNKYSLAIPLPKLNPIIFTAIYAVLRRVKPVHIGGFRRCHKIGEGIVNRGVRRKPAALVFKTYVMNQQYLLLPSYDELIEAEHLVRVISAAIDKLNLRPLLAHYRGKGTSSYHPLPHYFLSKLEL